MKMQPIGVSVSRNIRCSFVCKAWREPWIFPASFLCFSWSPNVHDLQDQYNKFTSNVEHYLFGALPLPILVFSMLNGFPHFRPYLGPHMNRSGSRLNFCQSHPGCISPFGGFSFCGINLVNLVHESDKGLFKSTFQ